MSWMHNLWMTGPPTQPSDPRRVNLGCADFPLPGYTNLDADPATPAQVHAVVPPLPFEDGALSEICAVNFFEHFGPKDITALLDECHRCLEPNGLLGIVVPDFAALVRRYLEQTQDIVQVPQMVYHRMADLDDFCHVFLYATVDSRTGKVGPAQHHWQFDRHTLRRWLTSHGFAVEREIDCLHDPRVVAIGFGNLGFDARRV